MKRKFTNDSDSDIIITIDASGKHFKTRLSTLRDVRYFPNQLFSIFFGTNDWQLIYEEGGGVYFIDYDPVIFRHLLNLLRMPHLVNHLPIDVHKEVWQYSLEKWGFTEPGLNEKIMEDQIYKETSLKMLVEKIKNQIQENEECVIRIILKESGYYDSNNKSRHIQIYIPVDRYELPWKEDLGHYLMNPTNKASLIQQVNDLFTPLKTDINIVKSNAKVHHYTFSHIEYSTSDGGKHLLFDIEFNTKKL